MLFWDSSSVPGIRCFAKCAIARAMERPLIRWAPHSELICVTGNSPDLLRVGLEEGHVELPAKAVDEELLEILLLSNRREQRPEVAQRDPDGAEKPELEECLRRETQRIVEEVPKKVDPGLPVANQHHPFPSVRIHAFRHDAEAPRLLLVADRLLGPVQGLKGQDLEPPLHDAVGLREEAVSADVQPLAIVLDGLREPPDVGGHLEDQRQDVGLLQQLVCGGQPRGAGSNDDRSSLRCVGHLGQIPARAVRPAVPDPMILPLTLPGRSRPRHRRSS